MRGLVDRGFDRLAAVEGRYLSMAFFSLLLVYTVALLSQAVTYSKAARLFPLIVGVPLAVMLAANVVLLALGDRVDFRLVGFFDSMGEIDPVSDQTEIDRAVRYRREFAMVVWIGFLVVLTWLFGTLVAVAVFVFAFVAVYERAPLRALVVTVLTFGFIYLLFVRVLGAVLWRGVVPLGGLFP